MNRTGIGYDVHQLSENRKLIIAGITIPHDKGSVGHSDGDVLTHAIIDAFLGAACLGDLGDFFPSDNKKWEGANSLDLLSETLNKIKLEGYSINNIDSIIIIQEPKLKQYILAIREQLAKVIGIPIEKVSVKATTVDYLGAIGTGKGWGAQAIVTISK